MLNEIQYADEANEISKRHPNKPLSFNELSKLQRIKFKSYKEDKQFLDLLAKYSSDQRF